MSRSFSPISLSADDAAPAKIALNVTASDVTTYTDVRAVWVTSAGNVALVDQLDNESTWVADANMLIPLCAKMIKATGTTASGFIILK